MIRKILFLPAAMLIALVFRLGTATPPGQAAAAAPVPQAAVTAIPMGDDECLSCHAQPDLTLQLPNGDHLLLTVSEETVANSVHGQAGYACIQCHSDIRGFPHPALEAASRREVSLQMAQTCGGCHLPQQEAYAQGLHAALQLAGRSEAATCTDCHGAHDVQPVEAGGAAQTRICQRCHSEIYNAYAGSVHGKALLEEANTDVPICIDCHNAHRNAGPSQQGYHLFSPQLCAQCHADENLMAAYGIRTDVFDTYVADFHGTTVTIFERIAPDQETNKPVCIDCHGVHNILPPNDENSTVLKQNLLRTCQRCHPDAPPNFSAAWLSHYQPTWETAPLVTAINWFYRLVIPLTIGGMLVFVSTDFLRRRIQRRKHKEALHAEE